MAERRGGIADDASSYEGLVGDDAPRAPAAVEKSGIAADAQAFENILEESTDAARRLDSDWLYQQGGRVFGPVKAKALLEMLYEGQIDAETHVAVAEGEFLPIRRIGVFRVHLPKVEKRLAEKREAEEAEKREARRRIQKRVALAALAVVILAGGSFGVITGIRSMRQSAAEDEKRAVEEKLKKEIEELLASVTIEPPLLPLVDEPPDPPPVKGQEQKPRARKKGVARFSGGGAGGAPGEELSNQEIMSGVGKAFGGFKRCIVEQMQREPDSISDEIVLTFFIDNDGAAQQVSIADRHLKKSAMRPCMEGELGKVRWRRYKGEVRNVEYPIRIGRR